MNERPMTSAPVETDDELLLRMQSGDEEAFVALYRRRQAGLFRFALHMSGSMPVAEDVTQEVFLALLREDCGYDPESRNALRLPVWDRPEAGSTAPGARAFQCGAGYGFRRLRPAGTGRTGRSPAGSDSSRGDRRPAARHSGPPRRYREVVVLCDLEEVDYADAAVALGCPIGTVRSRLHRARGLLLEKLHQERNPRHALGTLKPVRCVP